MKAIPLLLLATAHTVRKQGDAPALSIELVTSSLSSITALVIITPAHGTVALILLLSLTSSVHDMMAHRKQPVIQFMFLEIAETMRDPSWFGR